MLNIFANRDVKLIYSLPTKKRRLSSSASSASSGMNLTYRQSRMALGRKRVRVVLVCVSLFRFVDRFFFLFQRALANAQYEEYMSSQKTDIDSIGQNLSQYSSTGPSSDNTEASIRIRYSRRTRRKARKQMTREHLIEHQNDISRRLKCHNFKDREVLGRSFVFALLWLALNQIDDSTQISDLIRYAKESHIKLNNISSFLPPNVDGKQAMYHFRKSSNDSLNHSALRSKALLVARMINMQHIRMPNLGNLCERYVKDLSLPSAIADMIRRLIAFHAPEMKTNKCSALSRGVPNYEGRAMAYIIFVLKLYFGLDDNREMEISRSAQVVNQKLIEFDSKQDPIFVWSEWVEYVEMRNTILSRCHYPTAMQIDPNVSMHTDMYIDFLKRANDDGQFQEKYRKVEMENIRLIFDQIVQLHSNEKRKTNPSCHFSPTQTPFSSYMEHIKNDRSIKSKVYVPEFMNVDHEARDMLALLKPNQLKKEFKSHNHRLVIKKIGFNKNFNFVPVTYTNSKITTNVQFEFDVTTQEWIKEIRDSEIAKQNTMKVNRSIEHELIGVGVKNHLESLSAKQQAKKLASKDTSLTQNATTATETVSDNFFEEVEKEIIDDYRLLEPRRNLDQQPNMLHYLSSDDDSESDDSSIDSNNQIDFILSNFDYWIAMRNIYYITNASFAETLNELPKSFQWLLNQCALQIHMPVKDLYIELLAIENQYRYVLKPIFKMSHYIKYRKLNRGKLDTQTLNAIKLLKKIW